MDCLQPGKRIGRSRRLDWQCWQPGNAIRRNANWNKITESDQIGKRKPEVPDGLIFYRESHKGFLALQFPQRAEPDRNSFELIGYGEAYVPTYLHSCSRLIHFSVSSGWLEEACSYKRYDSGPKTYCGGNCYTQCANQPIPRVLILDHDGHIGPKLLMSGTRAVYIEM